MLTILIVTAIFVKLGWIEAPEFKKYYLTKRYFVPFPVFAQK